ncbi:MAG: ATP-grasp domain-containing protein [Peptoniphilaceae bacterium]|nr:ATP-grasp domain-containing protein [Peptoniphilaceae bacterium]MDY6086179.1 ATP-grasp domain-containing protein [Peptoniphilaceae bacterium]
MQRLLVMILGTDSNSYTAARAIHEAYGETPLVLGAGVLLPFVHSRIAKVMTRPGFSKEKATFVELVKEAYEKEANEGDAAFFLVPNEDYLFMLYAAEDQLDFPIVISYPNEALAHIMTEKGKFYKKMNELGLPVPETVRVSPDDYEFLMDDWKATGSIFMKAEDYTRFEAFDLPDRQKGYHVADVEEACHALEHIYQAGYKGDFLVQQFIEGGAGSEYSVTGYCTADGQISMVQARAILSDMRPKWVGNHLILIDSDDEEVFALAQELIQKTDYYGFFNVDLKRDSNTGKLYILECNPRLGRSFEYTSLAGVNMIELAIEAETKGIYQSLRQQHPFAWYDVVPEEVARVHVEEKFLPLLDDPERRAHSGSSLYYEKDLGVLRRYKLQAADWKTNRERFGE